MSKPFCTIEEQLNKLETRGIEFEDKEKAGKHLLMNNYYNVINCYSKFFQCEDDSYLEGTTFNEIAAIQYFDNELKNVLFKYIIECENHFKSLIAYYYSESFKDQSFPYLRTENFEEKDILDVTYLTSSLSNIIKKYSKIKTQNSIKHYVNQHKEVPLWVICNFMTLGQTITFFKLMKRNEQNKIAKELSLQFRDNIDNKSARITPNEIISFMSNMREIRNLVAHNNRVLDYKCHNHTMFNRAVHDEYAILSSESRQDVFNTFVVMRCFLSNNQFAQLHNIILKRTKVLKKNLNTISYNEVMDSLGFPSEWHNRPKMDQT